MTGNVLEWCADWYFDDYYKTAPIDNPTGPSGGQYIAVRGGFYAENRMGVRCASRHYAPPEVMQDHIGFRCAKTPIPSGQKAPAPPAEPKIIKEEVKPNRVALSEESSLEDIASDWPENVAKVVRALLHAAQNENGEIQKIAILMIGLGERIGAGVLKYVTDAEITQIAQVVISCERISPQEKNDVFAEIKERVISGDYPMSGGVDFAKGTLEKAMGPRKAHAVLDRINSTESSGFYMLRKVDPNQIIPFISKEHPQTISLILSQLDSRQAAGVVNGLPPELQSDVAFRIAQMDNISPQVLRELEESLANELQAILSGQITEIGGPKAVAEILNRTGRSTEKNVLERLDAQDPELAEEVRNQMFVFDDIANLTDREIQLILKEVDAKDLAVALKGGSEELQKRIFANMSEEVAAKTKEEMKFSGPVRMSDVEEVQLRVVQTVRQLEEAGQLTVVRGDSSDKFV
jgi:flagellar motor switch protein FliG